jgi:hypothetical protein
MKTLGKSFIELEFSSRRNSGNTGVRVFFKKSIDSKTTKCYCLFLWCTGKTLQHQYKDFLSDFKIRSKPTQKMVGFRNGSLNRRNSSFNGELYTILTNKAAKGKKGTIVADCMKLKLRLSAIY